VFICEPLWEVYKELKSLQDLERRTNELSDSPAKSLLLVQIGIHMKAMASSINAGSISDEPTGRKIDLKPRGSDGTTSTDKNFDEDVPF